MTLLVPDRTTAGAGLDADGAATAFHAEAVLNSYLRETPGWRFVDGDGDGDGGNTTTLVVPLPKLGGELHVGVRYRSPTHRHRFAWPVELALPDGETRTVSFPTLAALLVDELGEPGPGSTSLLRRMLESRDNVSTWLRLRRAEVDRLWSAEPLTFVESEQALLLGHPLHPTPKSRGEMSEQDRSAYAPETQSSFRLHWVAVAPDNVRHDSATGTPAPVLTRALLDGELREELGSHVLLPAHPWELDHLRSQPELAGLFEDGTLVDLGPHGRPVTPTTSVRTVFQADWPWQLKFSLHVRVTNSQRVTLPKELDRAVEAARLAQTSVGAEARRIAPAFHCVHDPAYLTVFVDGQVVDGFSVLLRENRWRPGTPAGAANVSAVTTLCQDRPGGGPNRLGRIVERIAAAGSRPVDEVGREWFARFCDVAVVSLVRLYLDLGLTFEPHQQNTLLELDATGMPERAVYRDSQGYFHREAAHDDLCAVMPGLGEATESIFPEALADERLVYYPFLNLTLGVVNALGAAGCVDETVLLGDLRRCLEVERAAGGRYPATLLDRLLDDERWPCKGNLRTRFHDLDELVGDIETQSVYVTVPNPIWSVGTTP